MPELPEVETIRLGLTPKIVGLTIQNIEIFNPKSFQGDFHLIVGKKVVSLERKSKILMIHLEDNVSLLIHLKMSGQLIYISEKAQETSNKLENRVVGGHPTKDMTSQMPVRSTRVVFTFHNGSKLYFNDQRKFGWIKLVKSEELRMKKNLYTGHLGPEVWDKGFGWEELKQNLLKHKKSAIKVSILDQTVVSGLGNIYACEALFDATIHPQTLVSTLTDQEFKTLFDSIKKTLELGIHHGGSSKQHYFNESGEKGYFLNHAFVYDRKGLPCKICQTPIEKIQLGGRGTFFCPHCQKIKG